MSWLLWLGFSSGAPRGSAAKRDERYHAESGLPLGARKGRSVPSAAPV
jgi:hypothetical protein